MTLAPERSDGPSLNVSSVSDWDFSALGSAEDNGVTLDEPETSTDATPEKKVCPTCGENIVRLPGMRGRLPKYHPACKPSASRRVTDSLTGGTRRPGANAKAQREADEVILMVKKKMIQGAIALTIIDKYSGFVIMSMTPQFCENLHGVLVRYDSFRKDALAMKSGGSIFGLILAALMILIPIAAHHGLIPGAKLREMLTNMPITMFKLAQRMKEGEEALTQMMERAANEMLRPRNGGNTTQDGSTTDGAS